jgi:pimeloyl-ACP methyl ester carboxylesterase
MNTSEQQDIKLTSNFATISPEVKLYYEIRSTTYVSSQESVKMIMIMGAFATMRHYEEQAQFLVNYFASNNTPIQILTYDHRGIGKSVSTQLNRQTSRMLANDALILINQVWSINSSIHIYGASLGGMVAQELALLLIPSNRLRSLYLAVTSRGSYVRPMAFGPSIWSKMMPFFIKKDHEHMVRNVLLPATFSPETLKTNGEIYATLWINEYDQWWAFDNPKVCACQSSAAGSHYLTNEGANLIREANVPITVQISTQDKLMSPKKQRELAELLNAKTIIFDQGHMGDDDVKKQIYRSIIEHIENLI